MYNPKDIQFIGKYDYDKEKALQFSTASSLTFSINIFQWIQSSNKKRMKRGKGIVRIIANVNDVENAFKKAEEIVKSLDNHMYSGKKTIKLNKK